MKKLLSLLSVLTISGTAVPTTIAASPYQKEENKKLNRTKRKVHPSRLDIQYDWGSTWNKMIATFSPTVFNNIIRFHEASNNIDEFRALFKVEMFTGIWKDHRVSDTYINSLAECIYKEENWKKIEQTYVNGAYVDGQNNYSIIIVCWASNGEFIEVSKVN